ncbi:MAG: hypothetical protein ACI9BG_001179 [Parasphingorhabdus sp.]|jgi:hypothetical protein
MPKVLMALVARAQESKHEACALGMMDALRIIINL